jgi:hypothetical protein
MRSTWANREQGERARGLYGPHTPRESGSVDPWHVPRPEPRLLDKMGRPVPLTAAPVVTSKNP